MSQLYVARLTGMFPAKKEASFRSYLAEGGYTRVSSSLNETTFGNNGTRIAVRKNPLHPGQGTVEIKTETRDECREISGDFRKTFKLTLEGRITKH